MNKLDKIAHDYVQSTEFSYRKKDYKAGFNKAIELTNNILDEQIAHYPIDLFKEVKYGEKNVTIDRISAQMARHVCNRFKKEIKKLIEDEDE